jgi:uncharacterized membrane protein
VNCSGTEIIPTADVSPIHLQLKGAQWFKVTEVDEIFEIFDKIGDVPYRLVAGNTGQGKQHFTCAYFLIYLTMLYHSKTLCSTK